jgi:hypothetical protein
MKLLKISKAKDKIHKYIATFETDEGRQKQVRFGAIGYNDYTTFPKEIRDERRELYLKRHKGMGEDWKKPDTPGALSRWILWEYPDIKDAIREFKKRFNL